MGFPAERFLRAGATFTETGELGALYGAGTTRFDGAADGELRAVIDAHRKRNWTGEELEPTDDELHPAGPEHPVEPEPVEPGSDAGEKSDVDDEPDETATEGKRARNQSRSSRPSE